ncbi:hypothetical protein J7643_11205 [bacterium]|nr:hypothetical protein [bacterium]
MKHLGTLLIACGLLIGCSSVTPPAARAPQGAGAPEGAAGTLQVAVRWPHRQTQVIPLSTQTIWIQVKKANQLLYFAPLPRPEATDSLMVTEATIHLEAMTGLSVQADAFRSGQASTDIPIASRRANDVTLVANQRTSVLLDLDPVFRPSVTSLTPDNGGPGVDVSIGGTFGPSGSYQLALGGARIFGVLSGGQVKATVPYGAQSGPIEILDDGVPSAPGPTFRVLSRLDVEPAEQRVGIHHPVAFQVPTGEDTQGLVIENPTVTRWSLIDPAKLGLPGSAASTIGTISPTGVFNATAPGSAWVYAWSGYLSATTSITVE